MRGWGFQRAFSRGSDCSFSQKKTSSKKRVQWHGGKCKLKFSLLQTLMTFNLQSNFKTSIDNTILVIACNRVTDVDLKSNNCY